MHLTISHFNYIDENSNNNNNNNNNDNDKFREMIGGQMHTQPHHKNTEKNCVCLSGRTD